MRLLGLLAERLWFLSHEKTTLLQGEVLGAAPSLAVTEMEV